MFFWDFILLSIGLNFLEIHCCFHSWNSFSKLFIDFEFFIFFWTNFILFKTFLNQNWILICFHRDSIGLAAHVKKHFCPLGFCGEFVFPLFFYQNFSSELIDHIISLNVLFFSQTTMSRWSIIAIDVLGCKAFNISTLGAYGNWVSQSVRIWNFWNFINFFHPFSAEWPPFLICWCQWLGVVFSIFFECFLSIVCFSILSLRFFHLFIFVISRSEKKHLYFLNDFKGLWL